MLAGKHLRHQEIVALRAHLAPLSRSLLGKLSQRGIPQHKHVQYRQRRQASSIYASNPYSDDGRPSLRLGSRQNGSTSRPPPQPPHSARNNPAAWAALLEPCLPTRLRSVQPRLPLSANNVRAREKDIPALVKQAREQAGIDLLLEFGLEQQRWDAMLWLANCILMQAKTLYEKPTISAGLKTFKWPRTEAMDYLTADWHRISAVVLEDLTDVHLTLSLDDSTSQPQSTAHVASWPELHGAVGQLWQTVGGLILAASDRTGDEASFLMSMALQIIAQMHHQGYVPGEVYKNQTHGVQEGSRPTMISELSLFIMSNLSDAASDNYHLGTDRVSDISQLASLKSGRADLQLGPELWLEFVLWCCLHGGWLVDAAAILTVLLKGKGPTSWHLICWQDFASSPRAAWADLLRRRLQAQKDVQPLSSAEIAHNVPIHSIERTVSTEVVTALVDALVSGVGTLPMKGYSVHWVRERVRMLKSFLDRDKMSLGFASWDEIIARFVELPEVDVSENPRLTEAILELTQTYGKERKSMNAHSADTEDAASTEYIFSGTASSLGIYHRVMYAYLQQRDMDAALKVLALLQNLTDKNKNQALRDFFAILRSKSLKKPRDVWSLNITSTKQLQSGRSNTDFPGFFPAIPPMILAKILDLVTESSSFELGSWLLYSTDVDGPLIAPRLYANQVLAPSIIRFAAATGDTDLLSTVTRVQDTAVSGETLIALCESRILSNDWEGATNVLNLMREHSLHEWTSTDLVMLLRTLIKYIERPKDEDDAKKAADLLQRLLRGDLGQVWGSQYADLDSILGVLSTISSTLAELCKDMLGDVFLSKIQLLTDDFNVLLEAAVKSRGSATGQRMFDTWCEQLMTERQVRSPRANTITTHPISPIVEQFSAGDIQKPATSPPLAPTFTGYIAPTISTMRIIVDQALSEANAEDGQDSNQQAQDVLSWAATTFRDVFHLREIDIDAELRGHGSDTFSEETPADSSNLYSSETMKIWHTLQDEDAAWLDSNEQKMRHFVQRSDDVYVVFDGCGRVQRRFLHFLAADFRLVSEAEGSRGDGSVFAYKTPTVPQVPSLTLGEWSRLGSSPETDSVEKTESLSEDTDNIV